MTIISDWGFPLLQSSIKPVDAPCMQHEFPGVLRVAPSCFLSSFFFLNSQGNLTGPVSAVAAARNYAAIVEIMSRQRYDASGTTEFDAPSVGKWSTVVVASGLQLSPAANGSGRCWIFHVSVRRPSSSESSSRIDKFQNVCRLFGGQARVCARLPAFALLAFTVSEARVSVDWAIGLQSVN